MTDTNGDRFRNGFLYIKFIADKLLKKYCIFSDQVYICVKFQILTAASMKMAVFWDAARVVSYKFHNISEPRTASSS
jgi:hypothetical protein